MDEQEIRQAIKDKMLYDYVANHYYEMSKEQLKELLLNAIWVGTTNNDLFYDELLEELDDRDFF